MLSYYGWQHQLEDRAYLSALSNDMHRACFGEIEYPEEIDPEWLQIEMQANMGSCQGHALMSGCELLYFAATGKVVQFSNLYGYLGSQMFDGLLGRDVGSTLSGGRRLITEKGCALLDALPYPNPVRYPDNGRALLEKCWESAKPNVVKSCLDIKSYEDGFDFMGSGQGPIQIGIIWNRYCQPNSDGLIEDYDPNAAGGGHSVLFAGYSKRKDNNGQKYWWMVNSHSLSYGKRGRAEVAPRAIRRMLQNRFTVFQGISDMKTPEPRKIDYSAW